MSDKAGNNPNTWADYFKQSLREVSRRRQLRTRGGIHVHDSAIDFGSNDYLGLRNHEAIAEAIQAASLEFGWGSGASSVLSGHTSMHQRLEHALAEHCQCESALVFSSGYACNTGTLACLATANDAIYSDALNHASLIDGIRLGKAQRVVFPHLDLAFLESHLRENRQSFERVLIVTESVFSMDGDLADLPSLAALAGKYDCGLVVDEAHASGIYGARGSGLLSELEVGAPEVVVLKLGTLSKALGSIGGFAAGTSLTMDYLVNHCRSYLFSTAPPPAAMAASLAALRLLRSMDTARVNLRNTSRSFREQLTAQGWNIPEGDSPIIPVIVGGEDETVAISLRLATAGFVVPAIRPPTVRQGTCRLRISLSASHSAADLEALASALGTYECPNESTNI